MEVEGIILAAGLSSRTGLYKMTLLLNGKTVIENAIDNMSSSCGRVIVVGGHNIESLKPIVERYENAELVYNENYMEGMFSSIKKGLSYIKGDRFFFVPGDYPLISPLVYSSLLSVDGDIVLPVFKGRRGHPLLIKSSLISEILGGEYNNMRKFVHSKNVIEVAVDCGGILRDIDTMDDYYELLAEGYNG